MTQHLRRPVTRQEDPPMTTRPATSNHTTKEIPSKTSCTATSRGTMKGSVDDVEHPRRPTQRKTKPMPMHPATSHDTKKRLRRCVSRSRSLDASASPTSV